MPRGRNIGLRELPACFALISHCML